MAARRALVTGATGYVGSNLVRRLSADGWDTHVVVRPDSTLESLVDMAQRVTVHTHNGSAEGMHGIVVAAKPDVVFHLASLFLSEHTTADISRLVHSNILFGTQLLEAMTANEVNKIVNTGTSWQHYENMPYSPVNLYAATKQAFEDILQYYVEAKDLQAITLKLFDTYGPIDPRPKLFHLLEKVAKEGAVLAMSPGKQMIDLVYIDDVVQAFVVAANRMLAGAVQGHERYSVSSDSPISLKRLVGLYGRIVGKRLPIDWGGRSYRVREVMVTCNNLPILPEWSPEIQLEDGIRRILCESEQSFL
jgi:nucleoside-diphosphate-sugar epimerase